MTGKNRTLDHLYPKSTGGLKRHENVWFICKSCNNKKGDRPPTESEIATFNRVKSERAIYSTALPLPWGEIK
jgi:5-methylcytosine-specific restriction endonuclease McrA